MMSHLPLKTLATHEDFQAALVQLPHFYARDHLTRLLDQTVSAVQHTLHTLHVTSVAYAWSGGKDSQVLSAVMQAAGIEQGVLGLTQELEYPAVEAWYLQHQPAGIETIRTPHTWEWLLTHQHMLFPRETTLLSRWYAQVWQRAQDSYCQRHGIELLIYGRRKLDGNYLGRDGSGLYLSRGVWRYAPLKDWTHEDVLAYLFYYQPPLPPFYTWHNGFVEGTHPWPMRSETHDDADAWAQVFSIDPAIVHEAARRGFPGAQAYLAAPTPIKTNGPRRVRGGL
jgi:hypothetical protein